MGTDDKKKKIEIEASTTLTSDSAVKNGEIVDTNLKVFNSKASLAIRKDKDGNIILPSEETPKFDSIEEYLDYLIAIIPSSEKDVTIEKFKFDPCDKYGKQVYSDLENINNLEAPDKENVTYGYLKNIIAANKNNPEAIREIVTVILDKFEESYDHNAEKKAVGTSQEQVLEKVLSADGEPVQNLICGTIHGFVRQALEECGIPAVIVTGNTSGPHATLMYKLQEGQYEFNNYGKRVTVKANNVIDAIKEVEKNNAGGFVSGGSISMMDGEKMYKTYAYKDEAALAEYFDKKDRIKDTPFLDTPNEDSKKIKANINIGTTGNISATAGGTINTPDSSTSLNAQIKLNNETAMFDSSKSFGVNFQHNMKKPLNRNTKYGVNIDATASYIKGESTSNTIPNIENTQIANLEKEAEQAFDQWKIDLKEKYSETPQLYPQIDSLDKITNTPYRNYNKSTNNISTSVNIGAGIESNLIDNSNINLNAAAKANAQIFTGITNGSPSDIDGRITLEGGLDSKLKLSPGLLSQTRLSGGLMLDGQGVVPDYKVSLTPGLKLNASTGLVYKPNDTLKLNTNVNFAGGYNKISTLNEAGFEAGLAYKINNNTTLLGSINGNYRNENISMSLLKENIEKTSTYGAQVGVQLKNNTTINAGFVKKKDYLNPTRNKTEITAGATIKF